MVSTPEAREATSGTAGETVEVGTAELASAPRRVAGVCVASDTVRETLRVVWGAVGLVSVAGMTQEAIVSGSPGEAVTTGAAGLPSVPGWVTLVAGVSASRGDSGRVGEVGPISAPKLVTSEAVISDSPGETWVVGRAELASAPGLVAIEDVVSELLWETFRVVAITGVLVSVEPGTREAVVFGSGGESVTEGMIVLVAAPALVTGKISTADAPGEPVRAGMAELVCVPGWVTNEAVVTGSLGETVRV